MTSSQSCRPKIHLTTADISKRVITVIDLYYCRFPFLANEIFNCEINALLDRFFDGPDAATMRKAKSAPTPASEKEDE